MQEPYRLSLPGVNSAMIPKSRISSESLVTDFTSERLLAEKSLNISSVVSVDCNSNSPSVNPFMIF